MKLINFIHIAFILFLTINSFSQRILPCNTYSKEEKLTLYSELYKVRTYTAKIPSRSNVIWNDSLLQEIKSFINTNITDTILIRVHSDTRGIDSANIDYTYRKANIIGKKLKSIYPSLIFIPQGFGEKVPLIEHKLIKKEKTLEEQEKLHDINSRVDFIKLRTKNTNKQ